MLTCPECHSSNIIWDQKNGYVICTNCGLVLDRIYVEYIDKNLTRENKINNRNLISKAFDEKKRRREHHKRSNRIRKITKILNEIKARPYLALDTKAVDEYLRGKRAHVKLFKHKAWIPKNDLILRQVIEKVINNDPILASRTERAKWAIARILVQLSTSKKIDIKSIANETKLSVTHIRRLLSVVQKREDYITLTQKIIQR